jgi:hypothetical protein
MMAVEQPTREQVLEGALRSLMRGYMIVLENGRGRILDLGGQCDPLDKMEASDPWLREARNALAYGVKEACTYPDCKCAGPAADGGCASPMRYTDAIGQAGNDYHRQFQHAHPLPALWRWQELWERMCAAAGVEVRDAG